MNANLRRASQWVAMLALVAQMGCVKAPSASPRPLDAALNNRIAELVEQQRFTEAIPLAKELVARAEANLGADNTNTVVALCLLAQVYESVSDFTNATSTTQRALEIRERVLGPDHPDTAASLNALAGLYFQRGEHEKAAPLIERSLKIYEQSFGPEHPYTATALINLAELYQSAGQYALAKPHSERSLNLCERMLGADHPDTAGALMNLAAVHDGLGEHRQAGALYLRSLRICETVFGPQHTNTATTLNRLALAHQAMADYEQAEPLFQRSLSIRASALGPEHPETAMSLNNLAGLHFKAGDFAKAESLYQQSLKIREKVLGPEHSDTGTSLNNLGLLFLGMGDYTRAETMFQRSLRVHEQCYGRVHRHMATVLNNLAQLYHLQDNAKAEPLYRQSLEIREKTLGPEHPDTAASLNNLALLYQASKQPMKAEPLFVRCLSICENRLGPDHPDTASVLNNQALLYHSLGQPEKAELLLERSLKICEATLGLDHPGTAMGLANLCVLKVDLGRFDEALSLERKCRASSALALGNILAFASEFQRLNYQDNVLICSANILATLGVSADLAESTLRTKGIVLDSLLEDGLIARASKEPGARMTLNQLHSATRRLNQLSIQPDRDTNPAALNERRAERSRLQQQVETAQRSLAQNVASFDRTRRAMRVKVVEVQRVLAKDTVLLELVRYGHYLGSGRSEGRYGAIIIPPESVALKEAGVGDPVWVPLATAEAIEQNLQNYAAAMRGKLGDAALLRSIGSQIIEPILNRLPKEITSLIISADSELNFLSFATLVDEQGRFLAERYSIRYVASGRDLLFGQNSPPRARSFAAFANPAFAEKPAVPETSVANSAPLPKQGADYRDYAGMVFGALSNTSLEAQFIQSQSPVWQMEGAIHVGARASETAVKAVKSPSILHLATHGFFLPDITANRLPIQTRMLGAARRPVAFQNPMQRSGLAFAGAQLTLDAWRRGEVPDSENDGILMAQEVGTMDLKDTWLVVLSACDTGIGEARSGEGVMGLRRGFVQAGAQNLLMTLWPISDKWSVEIMKAFYEKAMVSGDAPQAMADVQAEWLAKLRKEKGVLIAARIAGPFVLTSRGKPIGK